MTFEEFIDYLYEESDCEGYIDREPEYEYRGTVEVEYARIN